MIKRKRHISARTLIFERDNYTCYLCNKRKAAKELHIDHMMPFKHGGSNTLKNLRTACQTCNLKKKDSLVFKEISELLREDPHEDAIWIRRDIFDLYDPLFILAAVKLALNKELEIKEERP